MNLGLFALISILLICSFVFFVILARAWKQSKSPIGVAEDFIRLIQVERAKPLDYVNTFEHSDSGRKVLEQLITLFDQSAYVKGGTDAERDTLFKLGQKSVIEFISYTLAVAKKPKNGELEDE